MVSPDKNAIFIVAQRVLLRLELCELDSVAPFSPVFYFYFLRMHCAQRTNDAYAITNQAASTLLGEERGVGTVFVCECVVSKNVCLVGRRPSHCIVLLLLAAAVRQLIYSVQFSGIISKQQYRRNCESRQHKLCPAQFYDADMVVTLPRYYCHKCPKWVIHAEHMVLLRSWCVCVIILKVCREMCTYTYSTTHSFTLPKAQRARTKRTSKEISWVRHTQRIHTRRDPE